MRRMTRWFSITSHPWRSLAVTVVLLSAATAALIWHAYKASDLDAWIRWDSDTIQRAFGGSTEEDRIREIRFVREWEYLALKPTPDGVGAWLRIAISKRHCGNLMLIGREHVHLIRPAGLRWPDGLPRRDAVNCFGGPVDATAVPLFAVIPSEVYESKD